MTSDFDSLYEKLQNSGATIKILITLNRKEMKDGISVGIDGKYYNCYSSNFPDAVKGVLNKIRYGSPDA